MPLPSSGPITLAAINAEFGRGLNLNAYRGTQYYTSSGGPFTFPSGAISFSNFYGTQLAANFINATGGTVTTSGNFRIHTFTGSGTFTVTSAPAGKTLEYLIIAGGGAGGYGGNTGGGGAGGYRTGTFSPSVTSYTITVGAGGASASGATLNNGSASSAFSITSIGGGSGGYNGVNSANGGSGGGSTYGFGFGSGTAGQGNNGGYFGGGGKDPTTGGGGGGAGGVGQNGFPTNPNGGAGLANSITGSSVTRAGGGGGAGSGGYNGSGGSGGGGGGNGGGAGGGGNANTGSGGGGGLPSGAGGSGIVIIRYQFQ